MMMAERLETLLDSRVVQALAKNKIFLVHEFYSADTDKLSMMTGLHPKVILELKNELSCNHLPQPVNAHEDLKRQLSECSIIKTSVPGLDEILDGGLRVGSLLELCGPPGSGKTQICLNIAINLAAQHDIRVMYMDTKHDLMPSHFAAVVDALGFEKEKAEVLNRVTVTHPDTIYSLISTLDHLKVILKRDKRIKILIIDSVVDIYYPFLNSQDSEGSSLLGHIASMLHYMSTIYSLAVVIVNLGTMRNVFNENDMMNQDDESRETDDCTIPSLGKIWVGVPQTRLMLARYNDKPVRSLKVHRSLLFPKDKKSKVYIFPDGTVK